MIALIGLRPPIGTCRGVISYDRLPEPPAAACSAFAAHCRDHEELTIVFDWFDRIRSYRRNVCLGLVCPGGSEVQEVVASRPYLIDPLVTGSHSTSVFLSAAAMNRLRERCIHSLLLDDWAERYGEVVMANSSFFRTLIAHGIRGDGVSAVAKSSAVSTRTVARRATALTGDRAVSLLLYARLQGFDWRVRLGEEKNAALVAAGWYSRNAMQKARRRLVLGTHHGSRIGDSSPHQSHDVRNRP